MVLAKRKMMMPMKKSVMVVNYFFEGKEDL